MPTERSFLCLALTVLLSCLASWTTPAAASQQPFQPIETAKALAKRQSCISGTYSCSNQGSIFNGYCCANGQVCALDTNNNPACCPSGAVCTGTAPASFIAPSTTTAPVSYVANGYFSFPYIPTSFADSGACSSAVSQCSANYAACTSDLEGLSGYGVTIVVPGGSGTTVTNAAVNVGTASATSICNSLSSVACSGLQLSMCTNSATTVSGFFIGTGAANFAARPTAACVGLVGGIAGVAGLGIMGL